MVKRAGVILFGLTALTACAGILGFERLSEEGGPDGGELPEASVPDGEAGTDAGDPSCSSIGVLGPSADAGVADAGGELRVAIKVLDLGIDPKSKAPAGLNLDKTCTTSIATASCTTSVDQTTFDRYARDHTGFIDNAGAALLDDVSQVGEAFNPVAVNQRLADGEYGIVVTMFDWNGLLEDDLVRVEMFPALRVKSGADGGAQPAFTSGDEWIRDAKYELVPGTGVSSIKSINAYVTQGQVVAYFDKLTFPVSVPGDPKPIDIVLQESWVTAKIVPDGPGHRLDEGVATGRWKTSDLLAEVRQIYILDSGPFLDVYVCDGTGKLFYDAVKDKVCKGRDIRGASREDNTNVPCDAISTGLRFETYRLDALGPFENRAPIPARCVDAAVPAGDDCP